MNSKCTDIIHIWKFVFYAVLFYSLLHRLRNSLKAQRDNVVDEYGRGVNSRQLKTPCKLNKRKKISISPQFEPGKKSAITLIATSNAVSLSNTRPNKMDSPERFEKHICSAIDMLNTGATFQQASDATGITVSTIHRRWKLVKANKSKNIDLNTNLFPDNES